MHREMTLKQRIGLCLAAFFMRGSCWISCIPPVR